jgi:hypothetical protein
VTHRRNPGENEIERGRAIYALLMLLASGHFSSISILPTEWSVLLSADRLCQQTLIAAASQG